MSVNKLQRTMTQPMVHLTLLLILQLFMDPFINKIVIPCELISQNSVYLMNDVELVKCLYWNIGLTMKMINNLFKEEVDGKAFLLLEKKDISKLGMMNLYSQLCLLFPYAKFVDGFI